MSLIRFDSTTDRGPSASLWGGTVDWVRGSLATALGQRDFEDFAPYTGPTLSGAEGRAGGSLVTSGVASDPNATHQTDRYGVVNITEGADTNESVGLAREIYYDIQNSDTTIIEARIEQNADANSPQAFVGFFDGAPDAVFASGAIAVSSNQDTVGLLWNADETIDIVAVDDGTKTVLKDNIGVTLERTSGVVKLGLRIEKTNSTTYRLTPCVNGVIARSGVVNVASTSMPENPMRPVVATTTAASTAPSLDIDYIYTADK